MQSSKVAIVVLGSKYLKYRRKDLIFSEGSIYFDLALKYMLPRCHKIMGAPLEWGLMGPHTSNIMYPICIRQGGAILGQIMTGLVFAVT